jgi:hypothetical protein
MSSNKKLDQLIIQLENYIECWKQFSHYIGLARSKDFQQEDEMQFLEVKSVITQELEIIMASVDVSSPSRDDVHTMISGAPSIRYLSELPDGSLRAIENQWHKAYIGWQSLLGQLKVKQRELDAENVGWASKLFGGKKK